MYHPRIARPLPERGKAATEEDTLPVADNAGDLEKVHDEFDVLRLGNATERFKKKKLWKESKMLRLEERRRDWERRGEWERRSRSEKEKEMQIQRECEWEEDRLEEMTVASLREMEVQRWIEGERESNAINKVITTDEKLKEAASAGHTYGRTMEHPVGPARAEGGRSTAIEKVAYIHSFEEPYDISVPGTTSHLRSETSDIAPTSAAVPDPAYPSETDEQLIHQRAREDLSQVDYLMGDFFGSSIVSYLNEKHGALNHCQIADIIVLSFNGEHIESRTCGQHLNSFLDLGIAQQLFKSLESCSRGQEFKFSSSEVEISSSVTSGFRWGLSASGSTKVLSGIERALTFLVGTLRSSLPGSLCRSTVQVIGKAKSRSIFCKPLIKMDVKSCWASIFSNKVVYLDETASMNKTEIIGGAIECNLPMKIPFEWLIEFSGVRLWTDVQDGIFVSGPRSVLIPMRKVPVGLSTVTYTLHWHLVSITDSSRRKGRSLRHSLMCEVLAFIERESNWCRKETPEDLLQGVTTHMVSWSEAVKFTLGSAGQKYSLRRSRCGWVPPETEDRSQNVSFALGYGGPSVGVGITARLGNNERAIPRKEDCVEWLLEDAKDELVILYNPEAKQAWIVQRLSLIRHLAIAYCLTQRHLDFLPRPLNRLYHGADPFQCLRKYLSLETGLEGPDTVAKLVEGLLYGVDSIKLNQPDSSSSRYFYGYEARDLVYRRQRSSLSGAELSKNRLFALPGKAGWHKLVSEMPVVFFSGWKDPIVPVGEETFDNMLPRGLDLLAISMSDLERLLLAHNDEALTDGKIGPDAYWTCDPFGINKQAEIDGSVRTVRNCLTKPHTIASGPHYTRQLSSLRVSFPMAGLAFLPDTGLRRNLRFAPQRNGLQRIRVVQDEDLCPCGSPLNGSRRCARHVADDQTSVVVDMRPSKDDRVSECILTFTPTSVGQDEIGSDEVDAPRGIR